MDNTGFIAGTTPLEHNSATGEPPVGGGALDAPLAGTTAETDAETTEPAEGLQDAAFSLPVKFNKQDYHLSLEEATAYAQKGMKFDTIEPMLDKLKTVAAANGLGVRELVDALSDGISSVSTEERLATEFCELRDECPDAPAFDALPESVVRAAVDDGVPLLYAYLRHAYRERTRVAAACDTATKASAASAGAQRSELTPAPDPAVQAMIAGVRG